MRTKRVKRVGAGCYYHIFNHIAGDERDRPFGPRERSQFVQTLLEMATLYTVEVLSYCVMSNHFHIIVYAPAQPPTAAEAAARMDAFYGDRRHKHSPDAPRTQLVAERLNDISWFMHDLQQRYSNWFNRTRELRRYGPLCRDRFCSTILADHESLWQCTKYVALNPIRSGLVDDPGAYEWSSWGVWHRTGQHPNGHAFFTHIRRNWLAGNEKLTNTEFKAEMRADLARSLAMDRGAAEEERHAAMTAARDAERATSSSATSVSVAESTAAATRTTEIAESTPQYTLLQRIEHFARGLIVGPETVVRDLAQEILGEGCKVHMRLGEVSLKDGGGFCTYIRLRE